MAAGPGQLYFLLMKSGKLSADIYEQVLATGEYNNNGNHFVLVDAAGKPVKPKRLILGNSLYVYPGNPGQALADCKVSPSQWQFKAPTAPQTGSNLAVIAARLTHGMGGQAFPLPTRFDGYGAQFENTQTQEQLGLLQLQRLKELQGQGMHVIVPLVAKQGVFNEADFIVEESQTQKQHQVVDEGFVMAGGVGDETEVAVTTRYYPAFWGGVVEGAEASALPTLYASALKDLSNFECRDEISLLMVKQVVLDKLQQYAKIDFNFTRSEESKRVAVVGFFGSFVGHKHEVDAQRLALKVHNAVNIKEIRDILIAAADNIQDGGLLNVAVQAIKAIDKINSLPQSSPPHFGG